MELGSSFQHWEESEKAELKVPGKYCN